MAIHTDINLSTNDKRILNALFDPETLPSSVAKSKDASTIDSNLAPHPNIAAAQISALETQQDAFIKRISSNSETSEIEEVIREMDTVIEEHPTYPSAHLNRAMLHRMLLESQLPPSTTSPSSSNIFTLPPSTLEPLFTSLSRAIHLSLSPSSPTASVSTYQARILRTAFSHRAYLYLKAAEGGTELRGKGKGELEELASSDFANAARYGDEIAREMSVRTNPYAKMCGAIVKNALREEMRQGHGQGI
ncbi:hypothetical protein P154DRAFT_441570 [Amniculicola lignicola CBS 123094]|uniref:Uncharacterized protein n=1 Tax=Amniculicola lignicola CBS 123094 TaxID=1392246 RepID=A0A6A5W5S7_9PLEO|nr:hypothetical protein P154DRAFT_441570 [Amniculicola lignicola CBS 123094]